ncbi:MAG TPA: MarR family transcriptional regulator [Sphingobium sp.]|nr:MarR family transcriptional regulator [Sphingobium sp.]
MRREMTQKKLARDPQGSTPPKTFDDDYDDQRLIAATRRIKLVGRRYRRIIDRSLKDAGHSQVRWEILHAISLDSAPCTLMEVAARVGLEAPSIVGAMAKLEASGFIKRWQDGNDRRSRLICLTDKGQEAVATMAAVVRGQRERIWQGIPDADIDAMLRVLAQLRDRLWELDGD